MAIFGRTDLASEAHRLWNESKNSSENLEGVIVSEKIFDGISITSVHILDRRGSEALGKPEGKYYTIELNQRFERAFDCFTSAAQLISKVIRDCDDFYKYKRFLIAALGNPEITPDALGHYAAASLIVTRHLKSRSPADFESFSDTVLCRTGVLGTTGIESSEQIKGLCEKLHPDCIIVIDALAGADISRLCKTIQICNTGISPGSGVGNSRSEISFASMGVPVIAVGMPTVVDASFISGLEGLGSMFVTPRDIDSIIKNAGKLLAYGINLALHPGLTVSDVDLLVG